MLYITISIYFSVLLFLGFLASRRIKSIIYYVGGKNLGAGSPRFRHAPLGSLRGFSLATLQRRRSCRVHANRNHCGSSFRVSDAPDTNMGTSGRTRRRACPCIPCFSSRWCHCHPDHTPPPNDRPLEGIRGTAAIGVSYMPLLLAPRAAV